ncbi:MAG: polymerase, sigma-24 subunit, subfamily [Myxococcales bacterium]|nr:polymerase, sigma-24 subunit, subfamily [Myxococcales bacterium]
MAEELDSATLDRCRRGDAGAFRLLVERYQDRVFALCVALAGSDGEDLAQETFVRVHGAIGGFDPAGAATLGGWILTIARRLCTDGARYRRRRPTVALDVVPFGDGAPGVDAQLERAQEARALRRAMGGLPEEQRAALALQLWSDLDYEEIAAVERVPVGTVRSRLARAKEALKRALGVAGEERKGNVDAK